MVKNDWSFIKISSLLIPVTLEISELVIKNLESLPSIKEFILKSTNFTPVSVTSELDEARIKLKALSIVYLF